MDADATAERHIREGVEIAEGTGLIQDLRERSNGKTVDTNVDIYIYISINIYIYISADPCLAGGARDHRRCAAWLCHATSRGPTSCAAWPCACLVLCHGTSRGPTPSNASVQLQPATKVQEGCLARPPKSSFSGLWTCRPARLQMPPCSCSLPPRPKKVPCTAAKVIF